MRPVTHRTPLHPDDASDCIRRAQGGDVEAFEQLYRAYVGRIHALCRRMSGDPVAAEEITQVVFVRAWERLDSWRGEAAFGTWLHRLAVNVLLGDRRAEGRRLARVLPLRDPTDGHGGVAGRAAATEAGLDLERALDTLPPKARQVFVLYEIEGWPHEEIARHMDTTVGTSKGQLHRARELMRRALA
jgi:RNA polymerase sigma-70 factor (ECF subfamily)